METKTSASGAAVKPLILILDDLPEMREWMKTLVEERFPTWRLKTVGTAPDFHHAIEKEKPTLALMDEVLGPGEDLASLLATTKTKRIPVALMSSMAPDHHRAGRVPAVVLRRIAKPDWDSGRGTKAFLDELAEVMALTTPAEIG